MELTEDLKGARIGVAQAAELAQMHPSHFRRLIRSGVFPKPKRTAKARPYFDYELLTRIAEILKSGIGENGEEVIFYRRKRKTKTAKSKPRSTEPSCKQDPYLKSLAEILRELGIPKKDLTPSKLNAAMAACFGTARPEMSVAVPQIARHLLA